MLKRTSFFPRIFAEKCLASTKYCRLIRTTSSDTFPTTRQVVPEKDFSLKRALIVAKLSRYEFEKRRYPDLNSTQLEEKIRGRGTDYDSLIHFNEMHSNFRKSVVDAFRHCGVEVRVVDRHSITKESITWADIIVPVGGDGTFLMAASRADFINAPTGRKVPVVGFNSDPESSEGRLMLPKVYSADTKSAIERIMNHNFTWMHRSRIRITHLASNGNLPEAIDLHEHKGNNMEHLSLEPELLDSHEQELYDAKVKRTLPYLALNEVFIGETLSARVSHLQLRADGVVTNTKCSGLCVSTGTGSTSWHTSINRLSPKNVEELLTILRQGNHLVGHLDANEIAREYNRRLVFPPDDPRLCYSIREEIRVGVWPNPKGGMESRAFASKLFIQSRCLDASLVIDGSISYPFNDGAKVVLETRPEDALLTISMD
ncbi:NAD kinase 2, mitochondrial isoform X2 [Lutzomyia longipalpis]|uniref:NAD kinase 2, mitochondrial isoform X2 n=1 Tax=Lutzomyia longipalpis TaxID=7200 RepID=UPI0024838ACD|nr:NAD kinase 2, mitochondrial isoform X2 [Lutzomyia longipalpis]